MSIKNMIHLKHTKDHCTGQPNFLLYGYEKRLEVSGMDTYLSLKFTNTTKYDIELQ